jgi:AraC-like DNA-binding protein
VIHRRKPAVEPASYSVLGYININCSTLRETLANTAIFEKIVGDMGVSSTQIAEILHMSSRTLQRKLNVEDTQYKTVLNEVRLELALYFIENTTLSLDQVAHELGYTEARSFYRSFKQWTGRIAGSYRAEKT